MRTKQTRKESDMRSSEAMFNSLKIKNNTKKKGAKNHVLRKISERIVY